MAARKIKGSWWVDFRHDGIRYRKRSPHDSKGAATEYEVTLRHALSRDEKLPAPMPPKTVKTFALFSAEWFDLYARTNNKPSEQQRKRNTLHAHLVPFFGSLSLNDISVQKVEEYKSSRQQLGLKAKSINNHLTVLHKCLATAVEWGHLTICPRIKFLKAEPPTFKYLSVQEALRLVAHVREPLWRAMIVTALKTGLRYHELIGLEWEDVDFERNTLRVRRGIVAGHESSNKVNRLRYIPFPSDVRLELERLHTSRTTELVFSWHGSWIRHDLARRRMARFCEDARVPQVRWHALRHTYASHLVSSGATLTSVKDLLGHSTINMTMRYSHLSPEQLRDTVSLLEPKFQEVWAAGGQHGFSLQKISAVPGFLEQEILASTKQNPRL